MATTKIDSYIVLYSANAFAPRIWLRAGSSYIGQLVFLPNGANLPPDTAKSLFYHLEDFENCLDLLRNESPVFYLFAGSGSGYENAIMTAVEEVGEAEAYPT